MLTLCRVFVYFLYKFYSWNAPITTEFCANFCLYDVREEKFTSFQINLFVSSDILKSFQHFSKRRTLSLKKLKLIELHHVRNIENIIVRNTLSYKGLSFGGNYCNLSNKMLIEESNDIIYSNSSLIVKYEGECF